MPGWRNALRVLALVVLLIVSAGIASGQTWRELLEKVRESQPAGEPEAGTAEGPAPPEKPVTPSEGQPAGQSAPDPAAPEPTPPPQPSPPADAAPPEAPQPPVPPPAPLFGQCAAYIPPYEACLAGCAAERTACADSDYRCNEARTFCEFDCGGARDAYDARNARLKISDRARDTIWADYPAMQGAVYLINQDNGRMAEYALFPSQGYSSPRNIPTSVDKIRTARMRTPQYWLLLRIYRGSTNGFADARSDRGVPPLPPGTGVWYFARGLMTGVDNEEDLVRALYMGARGDPGGAEPILSGAYMEMPAVRNRVMRLFGRDGLPRGREAVYKLAYLYETLCPDCAPGADAGDFQTEDRVLAVLAAGALSRLVGGPYPALYRNMVGGDCGFPVNLRREER